MTYLQALPGDVALLHVFQAYPAPARPLLALHELLMRQASPFTVAERELIAAYVSGLNACDYCHDIHTATAERFGAVVGSPTAALSDLDTAPVPDRMKPVLRYCDKLTRAPSTVEESDVAAVRAAGWDDQALHDAVLICALFNFMNRMVEGLGIRASDDYVVASAARLHEGGYAGLEGLLPGE
jgi:uncharacterized peroxidase-related enzyme